MVTARSIRKDTAAACAVALVGAIWTLGSAAVAQETSVVVTGGYLHFPKIVAHTTNPNADIPLGPTDRAKDTVIQITNTSSEPINVTCYYVNANSHCGGSIETPGATVCRDSSDCAPGVPCVPGWASTNFDLDLTPEQPIGWVASTGLVDGLPCGFPASCDGQTQFGSVPPVGEEPFIGELRCFQVDDGDNPINLNDLKGEATIVEVGPQAGLVGMPPTAEVLSAAYNAISFVANAEGTGDALCLGGAPDGAPAGICGATYSPCAGNLALQHFFEGATTPTGVVSTELTLSPCSTELEVGGLISPANRVVAAMLVYNEFEQRFSTGRVITCVDTFRLADIDTLPGPADDAFSVFSVGTQGTLGGLTRIKGRGEEGSRFGPGIVGLAHEYYAPAEGSDPSTSAAHHVNGRFGNEFEADALYPPGAFPVGP